MKEGGAVEKKKRKERKEKRRRNLGSFMIQKKLIHIEKKSHYKSIDFRFFFKQKMETKFERSSGIKNSLWSLGAW